LFELLDLIAGGNSTANKMTTTPTQMRVAHHAVGPPEELEEDLSQRPPPLAYHVQLSSPAFCFNKEGEAFVAPFSLACSLASKGT
jgi:hypothetical protein